MKNLNEIAEEMYAINTAKGYYQEDVNIPEKLCLIHSEVTEALVADRSDSYLNTSDELKIVLIRDFGNPEEYVFTYKNTVKGFIEEEMADIILRTLIPITERTQYCIVDCGKEICECKPSKNIEMNKEKTVLQELFMQLKLQLGNNKVIQMFDEVYWLAKEQEQIEKAYAQGVEDCLIVLKTGKSISSNDYYQSKYVNNVQVYKK